MGFLDGLFGKKTEETGDKKSLADVLGKVKEQVKKQEETKGKLKYAMIKVTKVTVDTSDAGTIVIDQIGGFMNSSDNDYHDCSCSVTGFEKDPKVGFSIPSGVLTKGRPNFVVKEGFDMSDARPNAIKVTIETSGGTLFLDDNGKVKNYDSSAIGTLVLEPTYCQLTKMFISKGETNKVSVSISGKLKQGKLKF